MIAGSVNTAMRTSEYARLARAPMPRQRDSARTADGEEDHQHEQRSTAVEVLEGVLLAVGRLLA